MEEFGDGCILDDVSVGEFPHVDLQTKKAEPVEIADVVKATCERWYQEDQAKALLLEHSRRRSAELDMRVFEGAMNVRKWVVRVSLVISTLVLLVGVPLNCWKLYRLFSPKAVEVIPAPVRPAPVVPDRVEPAEPDQSEMMVASYTVVYPEWRKPKREKQFNPFGKKEKKGGFWENAFNPPGW